MSRIKIKNFGPIREGFKSPDGFMDIKKVTVFIGNQGSGKSTVAKLISTFSWMEKALNRGDFKIEKANDILIRIKWHNLDDYFQKNTEIEYIGDRYSISYWAQRDVPFKVELTTGSFKDSAHYVVPKITYIPAERNFLSTIKEAFDLSGLPDPLSDFSTELRKAQNSINGSKVLLPVNGVSYEFNRQEGMSYISGDGYKLNLLKASSGFQSLVPLYLVSRYLVLKVQKENIPELADISPNNRVKREEEISAALIGPEKPDVVKKFEINLIYAKYHNKCVVNILEEPEQNLYPSSQRKILNSLLGFNNLMTGNKLIVTTHSPYLINDITLCVEAHNLLEKIKESKKETELNPMVATIVPLESVVKPDDLVIYELDENDGTIKLLDNYKGLPSDENKLNDELGAGNDLFTDLLEIENKLKK